MRSAFEAVAAKKDDLGLKAVVAYSAEPVNLGWSAGNHITGAYIDSGLARDDTTYIDMIANEKKVDDTRFSDFAAMIGLFNQYSDPELLTAGIYDDQVADFAAGKYAFITQGSWIGASLTSSDAYAAAGSFKVGMVTYAFEDGMDTILTAAQLNTDFAAYNNEEAAAQLQEISAQYDRMCGFIDKAIEKCDAGDQENAYTILFDKAEI